MRKFCLIVSQLACFLLFNSSNISAQIQTVGLFTHLTGSYDSGYVLFAPTENCDTTYLIDKCGKLIHKWPSKYAPGLDVYLLPDGTLLRSGHYPNPLFDLCNCGTGGIIERIDWDGNLIWHYIISDTLQVQSHDICYMPNGHILVDVWDNIPGSLAVANGRKTSIVGGNLYTPRIIEIQPIGTDSAAIVWSWRLWDHLIQDYSSTKPNYGVVKDHPELVNLNFVNILAEPAMGPDWTHLNAVTYNEKLDQVMISSHNFNEIWILDHSTTTAQAATHSGGKHNKGGDLLYRWGNPQTYNRGTTADTKLFQQHNPVWITTGKYKDQIMIFNNGYGRTGSTGYVSSVDIIKPPIDTSGSYNLTTGAAYGPTALSWTYMEPLASFYSMYMGGAQLLPNGNVLITNAMNGTFFEIDSLKNKVWEYVNPVENGSPVDQGKIVIADKVYRCVFYPFTYSGFVGRSLDPGLPIELYPLPYSCSLNLNLGAPILTKNKRNIEVYPNPASTSVFFKSTDLRFAEIRDITGKSIFYKQYINTTTGEFNISLLPNGVYILCINGSEYQHVIIQH